MSINRYWSIFFFLLLLLSLHNLGKGLSSLMYTGFMWVILSSLVGIVTTFICPGPMRDLKPKRFAFFMLSAAATLGFLFVGLMYFKLHGDTIPIPN